MAQMNKGRVTQKTHTHEGAVAMRESPFKALERVLFAHLLWEDSFYIDGKTAADNLTEAVRKATAADPLATMSTIMKARTEMNIRHASLLAALEFSKVAPAEMRAPMIFGVIQRADELAEMLALAGGSKKGLTHAVRKGVAKAFGKFDEYQLGKYKGEGKALTLKDAVFLTHPKGPLIDKIAKDALATPDTWETRLSAGEDKKDVFESLLRSNKLGAMALLRNLRNMEGVDRGLIEMAFHNANWARVLPFRFMTAAIHAPQYARMLDGAFRQAVGAQPPLPGRTAVLLDTSGSMSTVISAKTVVKRVQAGAALAAAIDGDLYEWADRTRAVPNFGGLSTALAIECGRVGHGTLPAQAIEYANRNGTYDRIIVVTDMQFADMPGLKAGQKGYTINVGPYQHAGLMHGDWVHYTGWSDAILKHIGVSE